MTRAKIIRRTVRWTPCYRIVASRFPPVSVFDSVADPADLEAVFQVESMTNPRRRQELGQLSLVPSNRRISGPGTTPVMAAFTHLNPQGSRFSDGNYGVYYAAKDLETATHETVYHTQNFLRATNEPACVVQKRCYAADLNGKLHDVRTGHPELHDPNSYVASQTMARQLRERGSDGLLYNSVRKRGGQCVAVFYPDLLSPARQGQHLQYQWDGHAVTHVSVLAAMDIDSV